MNTTTDATMMIMTPYLHFTSGDALFFKSWTPSSAGAIAGASIGLFVLALIERWFSAMSGVMEDHWRRRTLQLTSTTSTDSVAKDGLSPALPPKPSRVRRTAPFVASHDFPRGGMYACQRLLGYLLMLAVMTFQAAYIIAIIIGWALERSPSAAGVPLV